MVLGEVQLEHVFKVVKFLIAIFDSFFKFAKDVF